MPILRVLIFVACVLGLNGQTLEEKETIQRTFPAAKRVEIDNIHGSIRVAGSPRSDVELTALKTIQAESKEKIERAKRDVRLDIDQQDGTVRLYVDGPFRCRCCCEDGQAGYRGWRRSEYKVIYDFELKVPQDAYLALRTVNDGDIKVENTTGDYDLEDINGKIEMDEVSGSGRVHTINRPLKVVFRKNPVSASYFGSINGPLDLYFQPGLSADFQVKTFNGKIYSDFPVTHLPAAQPVAERREGKFIYRSNRFVGVRVGNGGPEIKLDAFNGTIRILQRGTP